MADEMREVTAGDFAMGTREVTPRMLITMQTVRDACANAYDTILMATAAPSREKSLALTKMEEACMWATKAISRAKGE